MSMTQGSQLFSTPGRLIAWSTAFYLLMLGIFYFVGNRTGKEFLALAAFWAVCLAIGTWRGIRRLPDRTQV